MKQILSIIVIIAPALYFGLMGKTVEMGLMIAASSIAIAFFNIDKVQKFKGAGFEAEMKKNVEKAIEEAYATIDNLKEIAIPLSVATIELLTYHNRLSGIPEEKKHEIKKDIESIVSKLKIKDDEKIKSSLEDFYRLKIADFYREFIDEFLKDKNNQNDLQIKLYSIFDWKTTNYPTKEDILKILDMNEENLNQNEKTKLCNYLNYIEKHILP